MLPFYENNRELKFGQGNDLVFPSHLHNSAEMLYVNAGTLRLEIQEVLYELNAGDFAIVFPNQIHAYHGGGQHQMVISGLPYCGGFVRLLTAFCPVCPVIRADQLHPNIPFAISELQKEQEADASAQVMQALIQLILARAIPQMELVKTDVSEHSDLAQQLMQYVGEHFREPLTLDILARQMHVSKYHLSRVFSGKIGMSFTRYINEFRLDYAASLIRTTGEPLTQIWMEAGFDSQRTFNRVFHQTFGVSPSEYRKA